MKNAHTAGPWRACENTVLCGYENDPLIVCFTENGEDVTHIGNKPDGSEYDQCQANAKLIAAAPELLLTCKQLLHEIYEGTFGKPESELPSTVNCAAEEMKAAISKAHGK